MRKEHIHTQTHTNTQTQTHKHTNTHKHTQTHTQTQTHKHANLRMRMRDAAWGERGCFEGRGGKRGGERRTGRLVSQAMRAASMDPQEERCTQLYQCIQGHTKGRGEQGFAKLQLSVLNLCVCGCMFFKRATERTGCILPMFLQNCFSARGTIMGKKYFAFFP